jgi:hypothetical protein
MGMVSLPVPAFAAPGVYAVPLTFGPAAPACRVTIEGIRLEQHDIKKGERVAGERKRLGGVSAHGVLASASAEVALSSQRRVYFRLEPALKLCKIGAVRN